MIVNEQGVPISLRRGDLDSSNVSQKSGTLRMSRSAGWSRHSQRTGPSTAGGQNTVLYSEFLSKIMQNIRLMNLNGILHQ